MRIHPKVAAASIASAVGVGVIAILQALNVSMSPELASAITTALTAIAGYLTPSSTAGPEDGLP